MSKADKISLAYDLSKDNEDIFVLNSYLEIIFRNTLLFIGTIIFMGVVTWMVLIVGLILFIFNLVVMYYYRKA